MTRQEIVKTLKAGLIANHDAIIAHISDRWTQNSTGGIEKIFANAFLNGLRSDRVKEETLLSKIGAKQLSRNRRHGFMDSLIDGTVGFEFKAMRLPRKIHPGPAAARYDLGQIVEDHCRIREAKALSAGYTVIFVYGPLVDDAVTDGQLYHAFHNQLFVDHSVAEANGQAKGRAWQRYRDVVEELRFDKPQQGFSYDRSIIVVRVGSIGAIGFPRNRS